MIELRELEGPLLLLASEAGFHMTGSVLVGSHMVSRPISVDNVILNVRELAARERPLALNMMGEHR
jgi:hypothetical protein